MDLPLCSALQLSTEKLQPMGNMCILIANEPRAYREVIGAALQALRPDMAVTIADPEELDSEIARLAPQLVFCSQLTEAVQTVPLAWVMLYPDGEVRAEIYIGGQRIGVADIEFERLLSIVDEAEVLAQMR